MSLTRSLFNEFRPFFRMLDDPFFSDSDPFSVTPREQQVQRDREQSNAIQSLFWGPGGTITRSPRVHLTDEADKFVVEAEVPGVPKENLDISIGDNGRSLTIKGNTTASSADTGDASVSTPAQESSAQAPLGQASSSTEGKNPSLPVEAHHMLTSDPSAVARTPQEAQPSQRWSYRSSFERTIWLPRPVDPSKVSAKLDHGVLTLEIPKLQANTHRITVA
ncbi:hypothetical protein FRB99_005664 [Tulasnella sp. 403]|nr:hypothetical protein FRB99_005664 [Tulasnella sp. 403]